MTRIGRYALGLIMIAALVAGCGQAQPGPAGGNTTPTTAPPTTTPPITNAPATPANAPATPANPPATALPPANPPAPGPQTADTVALQSVAEAAVPAALRDWGRSQQGQGAAAYKVVSDGQATFIGIAAGMQRTGGYSIRVDSARRSGNGWTVAARVVPPPPGAMVTMALTNPLAYFKAPLLDGTVTVTVSGAGKPIPGMVELDPAGPAPLTVGARWAEPGRIEITGSASQADLHFDVEASGHVLGSADAQVKGGRYLANILATPGATVKSVDLVVKSVTPGGGAELARLTLATTSPAHELWSTNFRVTGARRSGPKSVTVEGRARAFEAVFVVEIRLGDQVLAHTAVKAAAGAPEYGAFQQIITLDREVPAGSEAWFLTESAKDGSTTAELVVPVLGGQ